MKLVFGIVTVSLIALYVVSAKRNQKEYISKELFI